MPENRAPRANDQYAVPDVSPVSGVPAQQTYFLGRYRIIDEIGLGGMASVHLARVDGLGGFQRWFAIKRIHAHLVEDETFVNMFLDEANVAARITHPNVATVFELGREGDTYWIAMEYLHGEPLREVMRRTEEMGATMPPEIACRVIAEAADGLHAAHELVGKDGEKLNLIHRDVTPHNLFVTYEGVTKVVDFGIAKFQDRMASTQAGTLKGKLAYMSPEQVQGESIDRRTDIFALGVVLWELTTGQRLFRMDSDLDTLAKVQECIIPPPSTMVRGYPLDLEKILMQALAKNREDRFPTAREFSRALQSLLTRRGLFIANDEVAAYMGSIFVDRIAKREEHLRWASAVSDAAALAAASASPAAGAALRATTNPRAAAPAAPPPRAPTPAPAPAPAPRGVLRPAAGAPAPVRPAAGAGGPASASAQQTVARPAPGPTPARVPSAFPPPPRGGASYPLPQPAKVSPPPHDDDDEDRTVQATAAQQQAAQSSYDDDDDGDATIVSRAAPSDTLPPSASPPIAAPLPAAGAPPRAAPFAAPPPQQAQPPARGGMAMAGRTMPLNAMSPMAPPARSQAPQPGPPVRPQTQMGMQPPPGPPQGGFGGVPSGFNIVDPSLPNPGAPQGPPVGGPLPRPAQSWNNAPTQAPYGPPLLGPPLAAPYGQPVQQGFGGNNGAFPAQPATQYAPLPFPQQQQQNMGNMAPIQGMPPQGTDGVGTRQLISPKRIPAWAVAVASGLIALVLAGGIVLIIAIFKGKPDAPAGGPRTGASAVAGGGSAPAGGSPGAAQSGTGAMAGGNASGLFSAARAGFLAAATPPPLGANSPSPFPTAPSPPPPAADTTNTASAPATAAPDPTPPPAAAPAPAPPPPPPPVVAQRTYDPPAPQPTPRYNPPAPTPMPQGGGGGGAHGYLSVICLPGCDRVELDGQSLGASPIFKHSTSVGSHRIKLVSSNPPGTKIVSKIVVADSVAMVRESMP